MTESTPPRTPDAIDGDQDEPAVKPPLLQHSNGTAVTTLSSTLAPDGSRDEGTLPGLPAGYLTDELADAKRLLTYAAEVGIEVEAHIRTAVLTARGAQEGPWSEQTGANLLAALTQLAAKLRPVTAESLKVSTNPTVVAKTLRSYRIVALGLACLIIPFSLASFMTSALSDAIRKDLDTANKLAVQLHDELTPLQAETVPATGRGDANTLPYGVNQREALVDLQQFAALIRAIDNRARQLYFFSPSKVTDRFAAIRAEPAQRKETFELPLGLLDRSAFYKAATDRIGVFQDVRYFAQSTQEIVATVYGAIATCILPVLYALLGACAFLVRSFEERIQTRTFTLSDAHLARFVIAAIGGAVVGLFNNFTVTQSASIPPLAIAFLVGYAVDVFFSSLEGLLKTFNRGRTNASAPGEQSVIFASHR